MHKPIEILLTFIIVSLLQTARGVPDAEPIAVIVHPGVPEKIAAVKLVSEIYSLETRRWPSGEQIVVFNLKSKSAVKDRFYKFIGRSSAELQKIWMRSELTGEAKAPTACKTEDELVKKVADTPNSIGYVSLSKVSDGVRILVMIN